jgi:hypothetical protein
MVNKIDWIPTMTKLYISIKFIKIDSNFIDDGAIKLLMSKNWPNLESLWLSDLYLMKITIR